MKLRFNQNQATLFRKGIDAPNSIVTIDVNPAVIDPLIRHLIADRMVGGIAVHPLSGVDRKREADLIMAEGPTLEDLIEAVQKNEDELRLLTNS